MPAQSILTNTAIASGGRLINVLLGIVIVGLLTRYLGPGRYGQYALLISFGTIVQLFADSGLYLTLAREIAKPTRPGIVAHIISLRLTLLLLAFAIGAMVALFLPSIRPLFGPFIIISLGLSLQSLSQLTMAIYQHHRVVWRAALGDLIGRLAQLLVILAVGTAAVSVSNMAISFSAGALAAFLIHRWLLPARLWQISFSWPAWRQIMSVTWPLGAMLLVNAIYFRVDMVILSLFRPAAEIGFYGLAYRLIESALFFPAMLGGLLLPRFSAAVSQLDYRLVSRYLDESLRLVLVVGVMVCLIIWLEGEQVLRLISGESFISALPLLRILGLSLLVMFVGNIFGFALVAMSRQKFLLLLYVSLTIFNLAANLLLIPIWGAVAAAWTTFLTELISTATAGLVIYRLAPYQLSRSFAASLLAAASLPVFVQLIDLPLPPPWPLLLIVIAYGFGIYLFKVLGTRQLALLRSAPV